MKHAINLPAIGNMADPRALIEIAQAADENGWDGLFLWDNLLFQHRGVPIPALDPWLLLGCVATQTRRIRLGPMVTPIPSRRIGRVARSAATLDLLSNGRFTLGCGLGGDSCFQHHFAVLPPCLTASARRDLESAVLRVSNTLAIREGETNTDG